MHKKYIFYDNNGKITKLLKCSESVFNLNKKDTDNVLCVPRNQNVPLDATIIDGEIT